jgi:multicomponent Na+:H+ antiporter subunit E
MFLFHVLLTLIWMLLQNTYTPQAFLVGFVVSFVVIALTQRVLGQGTYGQRGFQVLELAFFVLWAMVRANIALARLSMMREPELRPGIVGIPLDIEDDAAIALLAHLITFVPGTLSLDVSRDKRTLYVHTMVVEDKEAFQQTMKEEFERRVARLMSHH